MASNYYVNTPDGVNLRTFPFVAASTWIKLLPVNTSVQGEDWTVVDSINGYRWRYVNDGLNKGWCDDYFLTAGSPIVIAPPSPVVKVGRDLFGVHTANDGAYHALLAHIAQAAQAGHPVASVTVTDQADLCAQIKAVSPQTVVIFRWSKLEGIANPSRQAGVDHFNANWSAIAGADFYQLLNEWTSPSDPVLLAAQAQAYIGIMQCASQAGISVTVGDFSTGQPNNSPEFDAAIAPMLDMAEALGMLLNVHFYVKAGTFDPGVDAVDLLLRCKPWLEKRPKLMVNFGEMGVTSAGDAWPGSQVVMNIYDALPGLLGGLTRQIIGFDWFCDTATQSWANTNIRPHYGELLPWQMK